MEEETRLRGPLCWAWGLVLSRRISRVHDVGRPGNDYCTTTSISH